ncbi:hypothetical protein KY285_014872 [Solanum tuberosum]|nr:hypothetical protein KY285_014872 [Solanum tuberosum]
MPPFRLAILTMVSYACVTLGTSKCFHSDVMHAFPANFVLKGGEALSSISDVKWSYPYLDEATQQGISVLQSRSAAMAVALSPFAWFYYKSEPQKKELAERHLKSSEVELEHIYIGALALLPSFWRQYVLVSFIFCYAFFLSGHFNYGFVCFLTPAASKYSHSDDMHAFPASFGFKGEALSSVSDVSLLEIVSKTHVRRHGYRKHSVYRTTSVCTLELMIVDKMFVQQEILVSFKIVDIEKSVLVISAIFPVWFIRFCSLSCNEDDLLCTRASPSPLPLLSSGFGLHLSSLNKLNANDGSFKISGYISGPDVYTVKVLQYFCSHLFQYIFLNN